MPLTARVDLADRLFMAADARICGNFSGETDRQRTVVIMTLRAFGFLHLFVMPLMTIEAGR